jgi:hypothetical protein
MEWDGPKAPTGIHSPSDLKYHPIEKATAILIAWETNSHLMTYVMITINFKWRLCSSSAQSMEAFKTVTSKNQ